VCYWEQNGGDAKLCDGITVRTPGDKKKKIRRVKRSPRSRGRKTLSTLKSPKAVAAKQNKRNLYGDGKEMNETWAKDRGKIISYRRWGRETNLNKHEIFTRRIKHTKTLEVENDKKELRKEDPSTCKHRQ